MIEVSGMAKLRKRSEDGGMARFYVLFNSIPVKSRPREADDGRMSEM